MFGLSLSALWLLMVLCSARNIQKEQDEYIRVMKKEYDPLANQCEVSEVERVQCGRSTYDEDECLKRGCCYGVIEGCTEKPWCYLARRMMREECQVSYENKDDCGYYGITEGECYLRGCCWAPSDRTNDPPCFKGISVRLVDGEKTDDVLSGRVEVQYKGIWGTVCDDNFNQNAADVVCRSLGFPSAEPRGFAEFGQGSGPIWLDGMRCNGDEGRLEDCRHNGWGEHDCRHNEDAGVICTKVESAPYEYPEYTDYYYYPYYYYYGDYYDYYEDYDQKTGKRLERKSLDKRQRPMGKRSKPLDKRYRPMGKRSNPLDKRYRPMGKRSKPLDKRQRPWSKRSNNVRSLSDKFKAFQGPIPEVKNRQEEFYNRLDKSALDHLKETLLNKRAILQKTAMQKQQTQKAEASDDKKDTS